MEAGHAKWSGPSNSFHSAIQPNEGKLPSQQWVFLTAKVIPIWWMNLSLAQTDTSEEIISFGSVDCEGHIQIS